MEPPAQPQHAARPSRVLSAAMPVGVAVTALGVLWASLSAPMPEAAPTLPIPQAVMQLPALDVSVTEAADPCADPAVQTALAAGDDAGAVAGFGGGEAFRAAVVAGNAPCIALDDPHRTWVVVNKARPLTPVDFVPDELVDIPVRVTTASDRARPEVAAAIGELAQAVRASGAGQIGANNGYRSHRLQRTTYSSSVRSRGQEYADASSAKPGYSEHQTGLSLDVVACSSSCRSIQSFGGTAQSDWVAEHAWEHGFIVRYETDATPVTGFKAEPWHLRYIGVELAAAYRQDGFHTLEEFFGLPAAPDYVG